MGLFTTSCWFFLFLLPSLISFPICSAEGNDMDILALHDLKYHLRDDPSGILGSWNETAEFCQWRGVTCNLRHQRVIVVDLQSLGLVGSIPPSIGNLSFLREIHLQINKFTGKIPVEIGLLRRLKVLKLYNNSLIGGIPPSLANCSNLISISVALNQLTGGIPKELGSLNKLEFISVAINNVIGPVPCSLGNLSSLNILSAAKNNLYGSIPDSLSRLQNIQGIALGMNNLAGSIPPSIFNLSTVTVLDLGSNSLDGVLPSNLFTTLPNLQDIGLDSNRISGPIPTSISNALNLVRFRVVANQFTGAMPLLRKLSGLQVLTISSNHLETGRADDLSFLSSLINAIGLQRLDFHNNYFGSSLPEVVSNFSTSLIDLSLGNNRISGKIPSGIGSLINLQGLDMWSNEFSGTIPLDVGMLQQLVTLFFDSNSLSRDIPPSTSNLSLLIDLRLGDNILQGEITPSLVLLRNLGLLDLSRNRLNSSITVEIFRLSSLSIGLDLSRNNLTSTLSMEVGNLKNLGALDVSDNKLSGDIPRSLGSYTSLEHLSLAGNEFQGNIPPSLSQLSALQVLDLSQNNLSGKIPQFLAGLKLLQVLNLSYNHFEGEMPTNGVFKNASAVFIAGNDKLCGRSTELNLPKCISKETKSKTWGRTLKLVVSIIPTLLGLSLFALFIFFCLFKKERKDQHSSSSMLSLSAVSYHSLLKGTDGFSEGNLIGVGAFGFVYKGIITERDGEKAIVVKVFNLLNRGADKSFLAECEALRNLGHRNLVKVLTACSSLDGKGNDFKALVYEFMPKGSLENWLHPATREHREGRTHETQMRLSLLQRLNIAIDVACALDYLHHHCKVAVVHCDLKPSNVLLDEEMVAHVGDFGLSRFVLGVNDSLSTHQLSSIGIRGSTGYVAPECGLSGKVMDVSDPILVEEMLETNRAVKTQKDCLVSLFRIEVACSAKLPKEQMDIADVVTQLVSLGSKMPQY